LVADWAAKAGITPARHIEVRSGQIACALVAAGAGIAVVDSLTARAWSGSNLAFRPIIGAPTFNAHAVRHASSASSLLADAFVGRIRARFGRSPTS
jgi:DNA-binding transcriptional LysR family regulator